jgi:hypothetical protein
MGHTASRPSGESNVVQPFFDAFPAQTGIGVEAGEEEK